MVVAKNNSAQMTHRKSPTDGRAANSVGVGSVLTITGDLAVFSCSPMVLILKLFARHSSPLTLTYLRLRDRAGFCLRSTAGCAKRDSGVTANHSGRLGSRS